MNGVISSVENHGSIIIVWLDLEDGGSQSVYMDHRPFSWLLEGEGAEAVGDLIGRPVYFNAGAIEFLDSLEVA